MADGPKVYSIAAHRGFADALVAGLVPRYSDPELGLARLTLLLPSSRAMRTMSEAFIRHYGAEEGRKGLLMPRMAVVGDLDLDETLGALFDPIGEDSAIPPAADPTRRWLRLADLIRKHKGADAPKGGALLRLAAELAKAMDRLLVEEIHPNDLVKPRVLDLLPDLAEQWLKGIKLFAAVQDDWFIELQRRGEVDAPARRNRLFRAAARKWRDNPPATPIVAAGVTSAAPALARLLRVIASLPQGAVVLPDLDLSEDPPGWWDELGTAGAPENRDDPPFTAGDAVTHPQYHLKLLLNRMGIQRGEVLPWHRAGIGAGPPARSKAISNLFLPPEASKVWADLPASQRRLDGVRIMQSANPEEEAQAIALLVREALEQPEKRVALVTPDRGLAGRVAAHLRRWNITADDSAGRPLSQTAAGRVLLLLAEVMAERAAPVPLMALLEHPLVGAGEGRAEWLETARKLELRLRGPRPEPGLDPSAKLAEPEWWERVSTILAPLLEFGEQERLAAVIDALAASGEALCGLGLWEREDGRALSAMVEELRLHAGEVGTLLAPAELPAVLRDRMDAVAVRPPWGGHPRIAIYGLLEARMTRADLVICAGLNEGSWPPVPAQDPLLAPGILRALGVPGGDFRIGLSAHDLAGMLGAPEVVLSRAARDVSGPAIHSRFLLRVEALLGDQLKDHLGQRPVELARTLDASKRPHLYPQPKPLPAAEQRDVSVGITALDTLLSDPYQFYARAILGLKRLDGLDELPSAAWKGTVAHDILERWHDDGGSLEVIANKVLDEENAHPLMRRLWLPRLLAGLAWVERQLAAEPGRKPIAWEEDGAMEVAGAKIHGRADRIDRLPDGSLAIVDYKTGSPPSAKKVKEGFALQLGLVGMMAEAGGIPGVSGEAAQFEYWSLAKKGGEFGFVASPVKTARNRAEILPEDFLAHTRRYLVGAIEKWIKGNAPFTARENPNIAVYTDYDQLMRLEEWLGREEDAA